MNNVKLRNEIIYLYLIGNCLLKLNKKNKKIKSLKKIRVIFPAFIGDFILHLDYLNELSFFFQRQGYYTELCLINISEIFAREYVCYDEILICKESFILNKIERRRMIKKIKLDYYEYVINPFWDPIVLGDIIASLTKSNRKILADREKSYSGHFFKRFLANILRKKTYYHKIALKKNEMEFVKQERFMEALGINFKAHISRLEQKKESQVYLRPYCIISPGASKYGKRWEIDKFDEIIRWILITYQLDIILGGSADEAYLGNIIIDKFSHELRKRVHNWMGTTALIDYVELIRNAKFIITNDSAPVHIAASVNTPSVCIIGGWDYQRILPYVIHETKEETCSPKVIDQPVMKCFNCYEKGVANNNEACKSRIKKKLSYCCIQNIHVEDVKNSITEILGIKYE